MTAVKIYTTTWCPDCRMAKSWLDRHGIGYEEVNVETTPGAAEFVMSVNNGRRKVPTFAVGDETFHCSPYSPSILEEKFGGRGTAGA
jgi:mycoredoxin